MALVKFGISDEEALSRAVHIRFAIPPNVGALAVDNPNKITSKFLPLDDFHIVEIRDLDEASIRGAAKRVLKDRAEIKHTTVLNFIGQLTTLEKVIV